MNPSTAGTPANPESTANRPPLDSGAAARGLFSLELPVVSLEHDGQQALRQHIASRSPVLVTDLMASSPALQRWTPEYLSANYGHKLVRVYDASFGEPGKNYMGSVDSMSFADFLHETLGEGRDLRMFLYNIGRQIPELLDDVVLPDVGLRFSRHFVY